MSVTKIAKKVFEFAKQKITHKVQFSSIKKMRGRDTFTKLTKEQRQAVQSFWREKFGNTISLKWHEYYLCANGKFSTHYIPTYLYHSHIYPALNDGRIAVVYSDKNMIHKLLGDAVKLPKTYMQNINGVYYVEGKVVSKHEALSACLNVEDAIIKHSIDTCQGKSVLRFKCANGCVSGKDCPQTIEELLEQYGKDYIVQGAVRQSPKMAELNPTSLNTVRIMTYWSQSDGIVPVFAVVRMGRLGSVVDNASAGGLYCGVNLMDGSLQECAYTLVPFSSHKTTDNGIVLKDFVIPNFDKLKAKAVELHSHLPYTKIVGWDLCIDDENEIELVEINAAMPGVFQVATGPAFGDYTEEILEYCRR